MNKALGIVLVIAGFAVLIVNLVFKSWFDTNFPSIASFGIIGSGILAIALIVVGLLFFNRRGSYAPPQSAEEVPIYHGEGKHRKIVGYRKEAK